MNKCDQEGQIPGASKVVTFQDQMHESMTLKLQQIRQAKMNQVFKGLGICAFSGLAALSMIMIRQHYGLPVSKLARAESSAPRVELAPTATATATEISADLLMAANAARNSAPVLAANARITIETPASVVGDSVPEMPQAAEPTPATEPVKIEIRKAIDPL